MAASSQQSNNGGISWRMTAWRISQPGNHRRRGAGGVAAKSIGSVTNLASAYASAAIAAAIIKAIASAGSSGWLAWRGSHIMAIELISASVSRNNAKFVIESNKIIISINGMAQQRHGGIARNAAVARHGIVAWRQ